MKAIPILFMTILVASLALGQQSKLSGQKEAIVIAENFVRINGYCSDHADSNTIVFELFDKYYPSKKAILEQRYNSLHCKAFCISEDDTEWHIGFLTTEVNISQLDSAKRQSNLPGRSVAVEKNGKDARMMHKSPLFSHFTKL